MEGRGGYRLTLSSGPTDQSPVSTLQQLNLGSKAHDSFSLKIGYKNRVGDLRGQGVGAVSEGIHPKAL